MSDTTTRLGLPIPTLGDVASIEQAAHPLADALDAMIVPVVQGLANSRPPAGAGPRFFVGTDDRRLWFDTGSQWLLIDAASTGASGAAGGDLTGFYPAPTIALGAVGATKLADQAVTPAKVAAALKPSGGASAATEALRALGTGAGQAAAGNDVRLSDQRVPQDGSVTGLKLGVAHAVVLTANTNLVSGTTTGVTWTSVLYRTPISWWSSGPSITVPVNGLYLIEAVFELDLAVGGADSRLVIQVGGDWVAGGGATPSPSFNTLMSAVALLPLTAGQAIAVLVRQDSGATESFQARLSAIRLGA